MATVTIITPTLHRPLPILERCLASVSQQTLPDWEHWICSDGQAEPAVAQLVAARHDRRHRYLHLSRPTGHYGAGVRAALVGEVRSPYVAFLDDDNLLFPRFCERMVAALETNPNAGFAICQIVHGGPLHPRFGTPPAVLRGIPPVTGNIDTLQVVARTSAMRQVGWVLDGYGSDGATYERLARAVPWIAVEEVLAIHL